MTRHTVLAGFALAAVVALGSFSSATDQPLRPTQTASAPNGFPVTRSSRPLDEEAERIKRLTVSLEQSRAAAEKNLLLLRTSAITRPSSRQAAACNPLRPGNIPMFAAARAPAFGGL